MLTADPASGGIPRRRPVDCSTFYNRVNLGASSITALMHLTDPRRLSGDSVYGQSDTAGVASHAARAGHWARV